jgi:proteasome lid subunit RPN8/RPN11
MDAGKDLAIAMKLTMDYHLEDFLELGNSKPLLKAIKSSLKVKGEACGVFYFSDFNNYEYDYMQFNNADTIHENHFSINNPKFYELYLNKKIISLFHTHPKNCKDEPSDMDIEIAESLSLPSMIFSLKTKEKFLYFPKSEKPRPLQKRIFIPCFQDCVSYVKDLFILELGVKLQENIKNWARRRKDPNSFLFNEISKNFKEVPISQLKSYDIIVFKPSTQELNHIAVYDGNNYMRHHPIGCFPVKELFTPNTHNKVYKVYRYKDL